MPKVSEFFGITIYLYYREHALPHFHAVYGSSEAEIGIESLAVLRGRLPPRVLGLVTEWALLHKSELERGWQLARDEKPLEWIEPLA